MNRIVATRLVLAAGWIIVGALWIIIDRPFWGAIWVGIGVGVTVGTPHLQVEAAALV